MQYIVIRHRTGAVSFGVQPIEVLTLCKDNKYLSRDHDKSLSAAELELKSHFLLAGVDSKSILEGV